MKPYLILIFVFVILNSGIAQNDEVMNPKIESELPYYQIPDYPESYTAATVAARMIDGLGFRYYWATENLREEDLKFKPNVDAKSVEETLDHIYNLSLVIVKTTMNEPNIQPVEEQNFTFEQLRKKTLENFKKASDLLKESPEKSLMEYNLVFKRNETISEYPFWNLINGPIADAIWHVGQVVSFRRSSGNPINSKASVFTGKLRD